MLTYLLTPRSRVLLKKLTGFQIVIFPTFYGTQGSSPYSQVPATCLYPEPDRSSPYPHIPLTEDTFYYYPPIYSWVSQAVSFPRAEVNFFTYLRTPRLIGRIVSNRWERVWKEKLWRPNIDILS